jgi:uncharacterized membrane protein YjjB (DUF3815 family)
VSKQDVFWYGLAGSLVWITASFAFVAFTGGVVGHASWQHTLNIFLAASGLALFFPITSRVRQSPRKDRMVAALIFSAPGLVSTALLAVNSENLLPGVDPLALARYVALALAAYAMFLAQAWDRPPQEV